MPAEDVAPATSAVPADVAIAELAAARERNDVAAIVRVMRAHVPLADVQARPCAAPAAARAAFYTPYPIHPNARARPRAVRLSLGARA